MNKIVYARTRGDTIAKDNSWLGRYSPDRATENVRNSTKHKMFILINQFICLTITTQVSQYFSTQTDFSVHGCPFSHVWINTFYIIFA